MEDSRAHERRMKREMERMQEENQRRVLEEAKRYKPPKTKKKDCIIM